MVEDSHQVQSVAMPHDTVDSLLRSEKLFEPKPLNQVQNCTGSIDGLHRC